MLLAVADGAHDLVGPAGHAQRGLAAVGLGRGHRGVGVGPAGGELPLRLPGEPPRALDVPVRIRTCVLDGLVGADGTAALRAHPGVLDAELEHPLRGARHLRAAGERAYAQGRGEERPGLSGRAEQIVRSDLDVREDELEELVAGHAVEPVRGDAGAVHRQQERGRPGGAARQHEHVGGHVRVRDEELAAGQASRVESGRALEERERADALSHGERGEQVPGAPALGPPERGGGDDGARDERAWEAGATELLDQREGVGDAAAASSELWRDQEPGPAERRDLLPEIGREAPGVERQLLHPLGWAAVLEEGARRLLEELLRRREGEIHRRAAYPRPRGSAGRPRARTAMVVRWISEVPPARVWPQLVWY